MNLLDAFKQGGVTGLAFTLGANAKGGEVLSSVSPETRKIVFQEAAGESSNRPLFSLGLTDKIILGLVAYGLLTVLIGRSFRDR